MKNDKKLRILVIDDEQGIREGCRKILTLEGYEVETAENGIAGLKLFKERGNFAAVLVDLRMPGIDGMEVVEILKRERPATTVLIMTAYPTIPSVVKGVKLGATDYIPKPFTPDEMSIAVRKALQQKGQQEHKARAENAINKEAVISVLIRAAKDKEFAVSVSAAVSDMLEGSDLTPEERAALIYVLQPSDEEPMLGVSYKLKSLFASIASLARTIEEPHVTREQKENFLNNVVTRAEHALDQIEESLMLSRISAGELEIDPKRVNFYREVIQKVLTGQYAAMAKKEMRARTEIPEELEVVCDPEYIRIVYNNLISNATKYGVASTEIYLGYSGIKYGYHYFNVANVGEWIKVEERGRIFEKPEKLAKRSPGIGLHATREIIRKHGGDIWVEPCYFVEGRWIAENVIIKKANETLLTGNNFIIRLHRVFL